jgi:hypothetical protein
VSDFVSDMINQRFRHRNKSSRSRFLRVFFDNKGIEMVNVPRLLHTVNDAIPESFSVRDAPTVLFLRSRSIGSQIFNYKTVVESLETKEWNADAHQCGCSTSEFCDPQHGHIVTGNLNVITNDKLRRLLTKGPTYREANDLDWKKVFTCIKKGVCELQQEWCAKENVADQVLDEWRCRLLQEVKVQIRALRQKPSVQHRTKTKKVLDDEEVKTYLDELHANFVITPTDKAGNNFSIVCKKFYIECLMKELNISKESNQDKQSQTYKNLKTSDANIVKRHVKYMSQHNIEVTDDQKRLPFLYWIPKMHKNPSKQRYIAASHSCSTKPLSKMITFCLKLIQQTHTNHCKTIAKNCGYERMWIVDNSMKVLEKLRDFNEKNLAQNIRTYDFST